MENCVSCENRPSADLWQLTPSITHTHTHVIIIWPYTLSLCLQIIHATAARTYSSSSKHPHQRSLLWRRDSHSIYKNMCTVFPSTEVWVSLFDTNCSNQVSRVLKVAWLYLAAVDERARRQSLILLCLPEQSALPPQLHIYTPTKNPLETSPSSHRWKPDDGRRTVKLWPDAITENIV